MKAVHRLVPLDTLRGAAILLMIVFHIVVDLTEFYDYGIEYLSGPWYWEGKFSAVLFMGIAGASAVINRRLIPRGLQVFGCGLLVSAATYWFDPSTFVRFGILHLIGVSILTCPMLLRFRLAWLPLLAAGCFAAGKSIALLTADHSWFLPFGITPVNFTSMDYYPLLPWYGVFVLGTWVAKMLRLPDRVLKARLMPAPDNPLAAAGRHSLPIYLVHQPLLLGLLYLLHVFQLI